MASYENPNIADGNSPARLPAGGYIARITDARKCISASGHSFIDITIEIVEGNCNGWPRKDDAARLDGRHPPKHRGHFRLWLPRSNGSIGEDWRAADLERTVKRILGRNVSLEWINDHPEAFIGHEVGIVLREAEYNGRTCVEIGKLLTPEAVRNGNFMPMKKRIISLDDKPPQPQNCPDSPKQMTKARFLGREAR